MAQPLYGIAVPDASLRAESRLVGACCAMSRIAGVVTLLDRRLVTQRLWQGDIAMRCRRFVGKSISAWGSSGGKRQLQSDKYVNSASASVS